MTILILGATGRTGKHLLNAVLKDNHTVHALVRDKTKVTAKANNLVLFEGLPTDKVSLANAMKGCDAILSVLNISRTSDFPWAKLRTPTTLLSDTMRNIISIATEQKTKWIIICSAWGASETRKDIPFWFRWLMDHSNIGVAYKDHEAQETLLRNTALDYTIVRPVGLTNFAKAKQIQVSVDNIPKPGLTISRHNVAAFMAGVLHTSAFRRQAITISE